MIRQKGYNLASLVELLERMKKEEVFTLDVIIENYNFFKVYVRDARSDTSSRNIFMHDDLKDAVEMTKDKTHFIC